MLTAAWLGFSTGLSLILAIGAQNAFVLRQGLLRSHVFPLCLFCAASDAALIFAGVAGFGAAVEAAPWLPPLMAFAGAAFLLVYAALRFKAAWMGQSQLTAESNGGSLRTVLLTAAAFTWLNPHVYIDTVLLMGGISLSFETSAERWVFASGGATASFVFFFSLGFGARKLAPLMARPRAWVILDTGVGLMMLAIALGLVRYGLSGV